MEPPSEAEMTNRPEAKTAVTNPAISTESFALPTFNIPEFLPQNIRQGAYTLVQRAVEDGGAPQVVTRPMQPNTHTRVPAFQLNSCDASTGIQLQPFVRPPVTTTYANNGFMSGMAPVYAHSKPVQPLSSSHSVMLQQQPSYEFIKTMQAVIPPDANATHILKDNRQPSVGISSVQTPTFNQVYSDANNLNTNATGVQYVQIPDQNKNPNFQTYDVIDICNWPAAHVPTHNDERSYVCQYPIIDGHICGKRFSSSDELQQHYGSHAGKHGYDYRCDKCDKYYQSKHNLKRHISRVHIAKKKKSRIGPPPLLPLHPCHDNVDKNIPVYSPLDNAKQINPSINDALEGDTPAYLSSGSNSSIDNEQPNDDNGYLSVTIFQNRDSLQSRSSDLFLVGGGGDGNLNLPLSDDW